jgi:hypothetical protein
LFGRIHCWNRDRGCEPARLIEHPGARDGYRAQNPASVINPFRGGVLILMVLKKMTTLRLSNRSNRRRMPRRLERSFTVLLVGASWIPSAKPFGRPLPAFNFSRSHTGCAPLPARVLPDLSRYLTVTFRPFSKLPRPLFLKPVSDPNLESWCCSSLAFWLRTFSMSSRSSKSA